MILLVVMIAGQQDCFAQAAQYCVKKYTIQDGLPDLYIQSIYQDSRGFLWVGTVNGVSRFDGKRFISYGMRQGLTGSSFYVMYEDNDGRFWVGGKNKIFRFINNRFIEYPFHDAPAFSYLVSITQFKNGELWATTDSGDYQFNNSSWVKKIMLPGFENQLCRQVLETKKGIYYNYRTAILFKDNYNRIFKLWEHQAVNRGMYFNLMRISNDTLYVDTFDGLYQMIGNKTFKKLFSNSLKEKKWRGFFIDSKNRCWVNEINRAHLFVTAPGNREQFIDTIFFTIPLISFCYEDKDQNIWIASGEGLLKVQQQHAREFTLKKNPLIDDIRNITETPDKKILAFSRENGILQYDQNDFVKAPMQFYQNNKKAINDFPDFYTLDGLNRLWFATRESRLFCLYKEQLIDYSNFVPAGTNYQSAVSYNPVTKKIFSSQDSLKTFSETGIQIFQPSNQRPPVLRPDYIYCFKNGKTFFTSLSGGLRMIDENNVLFDIHQQLGFDKSIFYARFFETSSGDFWMYGTGAGIKHFKWDKKGFPVNDLQISTDDGLPSDMVTDMCIDKQNRLWVTTMAGAAIIQIDRGSGQKHVSPLAEHQDINLENPVNSHIYTASDGHVWVTGSNNIYRFNPDGIVLKSGVPAISIEQILLNQENTDWTNYTDSFYGYWQMPVAPILNYNENTLQINFAGISFTSSESFLYSYRFEGIDTGWSIPSVSNFVLFAKLLPGKYTFNVKCKTRNSQWSEAAVFSFTIRPAFWDRWWFRSIIIAMAASLIIFFFKSRVKKIQQQAFLNNQLVELEMTALKAQMNPHFIYNALNSIQALVGEERKEEAMHYIGTFSRLLRQVLENSERNVISLEKELQTLELYIALDALRLNMQAECSFQIEEDVLTATEKIPPLILQPFVENALWHGLSKKEGHKKISFGICIKEEWLVCNIEDNGIGRAKAAAIKTQNTQQYQSKAIDITTRRLTDFNDDKKIIPVIFEDLFLADGTAAGTKVTLYIKRKF
ncbi:MAG: histidine kinase [Gloeobacteraceae cyanobacterium ES-bin-316]|nr:histidine kinase [Ferruginibacter sp.]